MPVHQEGDSAQPRQERAPPGPRQGITWCSRTPASAQIATWRKQLLEHADEVFENGNPVVEDAERRIRELQAQVGEFTMERDFLSSALGRERRPAGLPARSTVIQTADVLLKFRGLAAKGP